MVRILFLQVATYGHKVSGRLVPMPPAQLTLSQPRVIYELHLTTEPLPDSQAVVNAMRTLPTTVPGLRLLYAYAETGGIQVTLQVTAASSFSFAALLAILPQLLTLVGAILTGIVVFWVTSMIPPWAIPIFAAGAILIFFAVSMLTPKEG